MTVTPTLFKMRKLFYNTASTVIIYLCQRVDKKEYMGKYMHAQNTIYVKLHRLAKTMGRYRKSKLKRVIKPVGIAVR